MNSNTFRLISQRSLRSISTSSQIGGSTILTRNFSLKALKAFYTKPVIPIPKEGIYRIDIPNNFIGRYRQNQIVKSFEKRNHQFNLSTKDGKRPLMLLINFNSPWISVTQTFRDGILFSPADYDGMQLWSYMFAPLYRRRWFRITGTIFLLIGLGATYVWFANRRNVPMTGRTQFVLMPDEYLVQATELLHQKDLEKQRDYILPTDHPTTIAAREVFNHLLPFSELEGEPEEWEVLVVNSPSVCNTTVYHNKKVWVYSGILDIAQDTNGLAIILSHEMAHILAKHAPEHTSNLIFWGFFGIPILPIFISPIVFTEVTVLALLYALPWAAKMYYLFRSMETEADYIGLTIMARAGYDIQDAVGFWDRLGRNENEETQAFIDEQAPQENGHKECQFLCSHPADENRLRKIQEMIPKIIDQTGWK